MRLSIPILLLLASSSVGCATGGAPASSGVEAACRFPSEPVVVREEGAAVLLRWEMDDDALWSASQLPSDSAYHQYRRQIEAAGADQARPAQHVPEHQRDEPFWARELRNVELAYSTEAGVIRPVRCLEALLFAHQNARSPQLDQPTEFLASVLRKTVGGRTRLRIYMGAGDELFPPKAVYGFDEVERDVADGWEYAVMLHNHTIQEVDGQIRLGVPAPSLSDVQLLNGLAESVGLQFAWVTNGVYTVEIRAGDLARYLGPE